MDVGGRGGKGRRGKQDEWRWERLAAEQTHPQHSLPRKQEKVVKLCAPHGSILAPLRTTLGSPLENPSIMDNRLLSFPPWFNIHSTKMCFTNGNLVLAGLSEDCGRERQKRKRVYGKEHFKTGQSSHVCELMYTLAYAWTHREGWGSLACDEYCDSDSKEVKSTKALFSSFPNQAGIVAVLCFSVIQRLLSMSGWSFHWLFHTLLEDQKRKKKIKFQFPSIALGLCNQLSL